ncbi:hypothetical protein BH11ARM1_BH11ARM1_04520 [soil metagenome]
METQVYLIHHITDREQVMPAIRFMADLSEIATAKTAYKTVEAIYARHVKANPPRPSRRIGASMIGNPCDRYMWLSFRWAMIEAFDGRMLRLFETGHLAEPRFIAELENIGCNVYAHDPLTGQQYEFVAGDGHIVAKIDGVVENIPEARKTPHIVSFKTASDKSFKGTASKGVVVDKPIHYAQMQVEMHLAELDRALYLTVNKNTDELYAERIDYDKNFATKTIERAERIIHLEQAPDTIGAIDKFPCKFCGLRTVCYGGENAVSAGVNCRSCAHSTPVAGGDWRCELHEKILDFDAQLRACPRHKFHPDFITFAKPIEGDLNRIAYQTHDGESFANGLGGFKSEELTRIPKEFVFDPLIARVKLTMPDSSIEVAK